MDSISSPKNSTRTGSGSSGGKTSRMPPRRLHSPATSTTSTRSIPLPTSQAVSSSIGEVSPTFSVREAQRQDFGLRHRLEEGLHGGDDEPGRRFAGPSLDHAQSFAEDLVARPRFLGEPFPGWEDLGRDPGEGGHVVAEVVHVADMGQHDQQGRGRMQPERRRRERPGRAPGAVDGRAAADLQSRQDFREPRHPLDEPRQVAQLADGRSRSGTGLSHAAHRPPALDTSCADRLRKSHASGSSSRTDLGFGRGGRKPMRGRPMRQEIGFVSQTAMGSSCARRVGEIGFVSQEEFPTWRRPRCQGNRQSRCRMRATPQPGDHRRVTHFEFARLDRNLWRLRARFPRNFVGF